MNSRNRRSGSKLLTILWLLTAISALVVTIVYFNRIGELFSTLNQIEVQGLPESPKGNRDIEDSSSKKEVEDLEVNKGGDLAVGELRTDAAGDGIEPIYDVEPIPADETGTEAYVAAGPDAAGAEPKVTAGPDEAEESAEEQQPESAIEDGEEYPYYYDPNLDPSKPIIALSFDDGPSSNTKHILETLEKYGAKATFFMVGYQIDAYSECVKAVYDAGCEIGNHTSNHKKLDSLSRAQINKEVFENEELINQYVPVGRVVVRPPYGNYNDTVKEVVDRPMFNWSVDSLDWKSRNAEAVFKEIKAQAKDGYIILCHDLYSSTAEAVDLFLPWLIEQGYQVTCISNMYAARGEKTLDGHIYRYTDPAPAASE